jgi:hypothetical protein
MAEPACPGCEARDAEIACAAFEAPLALGTVSHPEAQTSAARAAPHAEAPEAVLKALLGTDVIGLVCSDRRSAYDKWPVWRRRIRWATSQEGFPVPHLRPLGHLSEIDT